MNTMDYSTEQSQYLKENPSWHIQDSPWKATQVLKIIDRNKLQPKRIAEIGSGAGEILNQMHQRMEDKSIEFYGYEISPDAHTLALQRTKPRLQYHHDNLLDLDEKFDLLLMIDVFEHVEDYIGFIKAASKKATYKIYHIPLDISMYSIMINNFHHVRKSVGHLHYFNKETALATLRHTGQEVVDYFYTRGSLEVNNKNLTLFGKFVNLMRRVFYRIKPDWAQKIWGGFSLIVLTK